jgi:hypothetical protein
VHIEREQMCCYLTRTTSTTHQIIRDNLHETPTYGGWVEAKGPRYCPSIEDKVFFDNIYMPYFKKLTCFNIWGALGRVYLGLSHDINTCLSVRESLNC